MTVADIPNSRVPVADKEGRVTTPWYRFMLALWTRTGGRVDDIEDGAGIVSDLNVEFPVSPHVARVAELEKRIENLERELDVKTAQLAQFAALTRRVQMIEFDMSAKTDYSARIAALTRRVQNLEIEL